MAMVNVRSGDEIDATNGAFIILGIQPDLKIGNGKTISPQPLCKFIFSCLFGVPDSIPLHRLSAGVFLFFRLARSGIIFRPARIPLTTTIPATVAQFVRGLGVLRKIRQGFFNPAFCTLFHTRALSHYFALSRNFRLPGHIHHLP